MLVILGQDGLGSGGLNFDAKLRCGSSDTLDLFYAHIGGMDAFARGLLIAQQLIDDGVLADFVYDRYAGYQSGIGLEIMEGRAGFVDLERFVFDKGEPVLKSGRQEYLENIINYYL